MAPESSNGGGVVQEAVAQVGVRAGRGCGTARTSLPLSASSLCLCLCACACGVHHCPPGCAAAHALQPVQLSASGPRVQRMPAPRPARSSLAQTS